MLSIQFLTFCVGAPGHTKMSVSCSQFHQRVRYFYLKLCFTLFHSKYGLRPKDVKLCNTKTKTVKKVGSPTN